MSTIGEYARLTPAELEQALRDPEWAEDFIGDMAGTKPHDGADPATARRLDIGRAWHTLDFLLRPAGLPVDIVQGEADIPVTELWGSVPPRCLTPERVRTAAEALAEIDAAGLVEGVTAEDLAAEEIHPAFVWEHGEPLTSVTACHSVLVAFFRAAADEGDALLIRLD
ncbi:YfbM family protein [Streptomyces sp. CAU 1734]|uniref:YfbM family protein n=1 Tax=Streptomyces sp. CAU 1734 TaxID=3140360 RepID=UPI00326021F5